MSTRASRGTPLFLVLLSSCLGAPPAPSPAGAGPDEAQGEEPPSSSLVPRPPALFEAPPAFLSPDPPPSPISLTASDGSGLRLARMTASAVVEGPLSFTE